MAEPASAGAAAAAAASHYKKLKEDFVSNLSGGTTGEVFLVAAVAPVAVLGWSLLQHRKAFFRTRSPIAVAVDFCFNALSILLAITNYSHNPVLLSGLLLALALFIYAQPRDGEARRKAVKKPKPAAAAASATPPPNPLPKKAFLTTYRGAMMVITCLAILAVDFRIFPRRFAKVETWGTSLMDMGVGSFVFSAGVVAARAVLKERITGRATPLGQRLLVSLRHSLPLLVLGVVRLVSVKGLDYAEHVTEYGVHWNFFFTLGLLPPFVALSQSVRQVLPSSAGLALLLSAAYQLALETTSLKAYILTAPRTSLLSKNREGLFSFIGYLAIFLAGQDTGMYVLPAETTTKTETKASVLSRLRAAVAAHPLVAWAAVWWALHQATIGFPYGLGLAESRRLANLPYVLWVLAFNTQQLTLFHAIDRLVFGSRDKSGARATAADEAAAHDDATSMVLRAFNRNGLAVFLLANLLTGLVNLTVPTLDVARPTAFGILAAYAGALTTVAVALDAYDVTIKL